MKQMLFRLFTVLYVTFSLALATAAPKPLDFDHRLSISQFSGSTFLNAMTARNGIKATLDKDYETMYRVADWEVIEAAVHNFDRKIVGRVLGAFSNGKFGLKKFV